MSPRKKRVQRGCKYKRGLCPCGLCLHCPPSRWKGHEVNPECLDHGGRCGVVEPRECEATSSSALARTKARSTGILHPRNTATKPDVLRRSSRIERLERVVYHEDISGNSERDEKTLAQKISDVLRNLSLISRQKRVGEKSLSIMNKWRFPNGIERGLTLSYGSSSIL